MQSLGSNADRKALVESDEWTGPAYQTCKDAAYVGGVFEKSRRRDLVPFGHHREVAGIPDAEADQLLDWCEAEYNKIGRVPTRVVLREKVKQVKAWLAQGWTQSQLERRKLIEQGFAVVASKRNGADGKPMDAALIDGRNRLAACKLVGITPEYRIVEADADKLKSLVWSWNGPRRHLSSSQKAMAYAMMYPKGNQGKRSDLLQNCKKLDDERIDASAISRARFILKNDREKAELVRDGHPDFPLSKTYDSVKEDAERRKQQAELERQKLEQLTSLHWLTISVLVCRKQ